MLEIPQHFSEKVNPDIAVDQVAYKDTAPKIAVMKNTKGGTFYLVDRATGSAVFAGDMKGPVWDETNRCEVFHLDFSAVQACGEYEIQTETGRSYPVTIAKDPLQKLTNAMIKALYFQRCGCALTKPFAGAYTHEACHNTPAYLLTDPSVVVQDVSGGWHDAGDYGKYITPANQTVFNMLYAYELFPAGVSDNLNIPETGNGVPDILNEARYELEFMLKMQNDEGGVYHKVTTEQFAGNVMPDEDEHTIQALSPVTVTATGGFAAAMAAASRVYRPFDNTFADKCLKAAKKAFAYGMEHYKEHKEFHNVAPCVTGVYGDSCCLDEMYWGAAELYRTTHEPYYQEQFRLFFNMDFDKTAFGAYYQGGHGSLCYCLCEDADPALRQQVLHEIVRGADTALQIAQDNAYMVALRPETKTQESDYYWGSNAVLTNRLANMISAAILTKTTKYDQAIADSVSYLCGRNYISKCYVTGFGTDGVRHPHHRPSMFDGIDAPVPGLIAGGANDRPGQRPKNSEGWPSAACYIDWEWNWTTNEVAIYWNSSCFYVTGYLRALQKK